MLGDTSEVVLAVVTLLVAVVVAAASGGTLQRLGTLPLRRAWLVGVAVLVQLLGGVLGGLLYAVGLVASAVLVLRFLVANRGLRGTGLLYAGLFANALVVAVNGAMPVSVHAADRAGVTTQAILSGADPRHEIAGADTTLRWLGDVLPVPFPVHPEVVSPGDVLVAAGLAQLVVAGMRRGQPRARHARGRSPARLVRPL